MKSPGLISSLDISETEFQPIVDGLCCCSKTTSNMRPHYPVYKVVEPVSTQRETLKYFISCNTQTLQSFLNTSKGFLKLSNDFRKFRLCSNIPGCILFSSSRNCNFSSFLILFVKPSDKPCF